MSILPISNEKMTVSQLLNNFIYYRKSFGFSDNTVLQSISLCRLFSHWCYEKGYTTADLNRQVYYQYISSLYDRGLKKSTICKHIDFLKKFSEFLLENRMAYENYADGLIRPKTTEKVIQTLSEKQIKLMFKTLHTFGEKESKQKGPLFFLLLDTGLRISEALSLKPSSFNFDRRLILVNGKGDKQREVPFSSKTEDLIRTLISEHDVSHNQYIWQGRNRKMMTSATVRRTLYRIKEKIAGQEGMETVELRPHLFRHTFAKHWIMSGGDPLSLKRILGHTRLDMTMRYVHMWGDDLVQKHEIHGPKLDIVVET